MKPPKEANSDPNKLWKLNTTIYGLNDASRSWYLNVKSELTKLGAKTCQSDPSVFVWHSNAKLNGILCTHVDDFLFGGTQIFLENIIAPLKKIFTIGEEHCKAFKHLGLNINQCNTEIILDQNEYIDSLDYINISKNRKQQKNDKLSSDEIDELRSLVGQLGWVAGQTRPDLAFEVCQLSSSINHSTVNDLIKANKLLAKAKNENVSIRLGLPGSPYDFKIIAYNDSSLGNLNDGGSQGGFIIYLVDENNICSPIMWRSKKLRRVVKSAMAAETLIQVDSAEASYWLATLLSEMLYGQSNYQNKIIIECNTDNHQLYDSVLSIGPVQDKRLRIEISILREMLNKKEINKINWIEKHFQIADCLTKSGASSKLLLNTFKFKSISS